MILQLRMAFGVVLQCLDHQSYGIAKPGCAKLYLVIDNLRCMHGRTPFPEGDPRTLYSRVAWDLKPLYWR